MTPEYASPEQVRGDPLSTATDVYALGVILYQLLVGERPYAFTKRSPDEVVRVVTQHQLEPPSSRARRIDDPPLDPRDLNSDLDTIVAKAMHQDVAHRYTSAQALAEDLRRFRLGLPIHARGDSMVYRAGKFLRRHTLPASLICGDPGAD